MEVFSLYTSNIYTAPSQDCIVGDYTASYTQKQAMTGVFTSGVARIFVMPGPEVDAERLHLMAFGDCLHYSEEVTH